MFSTQPRAIIHLTNEQLCEKAGYSTVQVNRTDEENNGFKNTEMRTADVASDYDATVNAFNGCDAVIHLAAIPNPVGTPDHKVPRPAHRAQSQIDSD